MTLLKPVITEKSILGASRGVFTFAVELNTTKTQVKTIVQDLFKVHVLKVNLKRTHLPGKKTGSRRLQQADSAAKYASVWLKPGETIGLFDLKETK